MPDAPGTSTQLSLVYPSPSGKSLAHPLPPGSTSIGSAPDNDLVVEGDGVQPHHAVVTLEGGQVTLRDLFAGKTTVNDEPKTSGPLGTGDVLGLGGLRLRLMRVATSSRRMRRPDPKDDTTKRTSRRALDLETGSSSFRRPSSRRINLTGRRPTAGSDSDTARVSGARRRNTAPPETDTARVPGPTTRGSRRRDGPLTTGGRRRSARSTKDWLGELNNDPEETQGLGRKKAAQPEPSPEAKGLEVRVKRLTSRLRKAETRARSAQERLKHLEQELRERPPAGEAPAGGDHDLASLHELCAGLVDESDIEAVLEQIAEALLHTFRADRAVAVLTEEDGRNPLLNAERVRGEAESDSKETGVAPEILEETLHTRRPLEVGGEGGFGGLAAPILRGGRTFGIIYFERTRQGGRPIELADKQLMTVFATLACLVIQPMMSEL